MAKKKSPAHSAQKLLAKTCIAFLLEDILFPGKVNPNVDMKIVQAELKKMQKFAKLHSEFCWIGVSGLKVEVCLDKIKQHGLQNFFPDEKVFAVNDAYILKMEEIDKGLYDKKCENDSECKDEYFRQVALQEFIQKEKIPPEKMLLVGHDYWFDGFYTRRFSKIDFALVQSALTSKGHLAQEHVQGLWYINLDWNEIQPILEGKVSPPQYKYLDAFVVSSISKELFGGQGFSLQKKVVDLRDLKKKE